MALTPQNSETFLREVDEELRREQALAVWKRWGVWIVVAIVAALAAFGGYLFWRHQQTVRGERLGEQLQSAYDYLGAGDTKGAAKPLAELTASDVKGYRVLAIFTQADILLQKDDLKGAAAKFASVADDASVAQPFRDLARIRQTAAEFDTLKPDVIVQRLTPLTVAGSAWLGSAGEMVAAAYIRQGKRDAAGQMFARIAADENTPRSLRQRAVQMAGAMGVDAPALAPATQDKAAQ